MKQPDTLVGVSSSNWSESEAIGELGKGDNILCLNDGAWNSGSPPEEELAPA